MRKMFLAAVAALSIATAAKADARVDPLPDAMVGSWCPDNQKMDDDDSVPLVYSRRSLTRGTCEGGINVATNSYAHSEFGCVFRSVKRVRDGAYSVKSHCSESPPVSWDSTDVFQVIDGRLVIANKPMTASELKAVLAATKPEPTELECAVVVAPRDADGFPGKLNMRAAPDVNARVMGQLEDGTVLFGMNDRTLTGTGTEARRGAEEPQPTRRRTCVRPSSRS